MTKKSSKLKQKKFLSEEALEIKRLIIILIGVLIFITGIYFLSKLIVDKRDNSINNTSVEGVVNYDVVSIGMILNRPYDNYYVIIYNSSETKAATYASAASKYMQKEDGTKLYTCDLANRLNKDYISKSKTGNKKAKTTNEFSFGEVTLLQISNGQITKYVEDFDTIKSILQ